MTASTCRVASMALVTTVSTLTCASAKLVGLERVVKPTSTNAYRIHARMAALVWTRKITSTVYARLVSWAPHVKTRRSNVRPTRANTVARVMNYQMHLHVHAKEAIQAPCVRPMSMSVLPFPVSMAERASTTSVVSTVRVRTAGLDRRVRKRVDGS
jgi:hypothetical protein